MRNLESSTAAAPARVEDVRTDLVQTDFESLPGLFGRLGDDVMTLVDTKLSLLKVEVKEDVDTYVHGGIMISMGLIVAAVGFALLNVAVAFLVSTLFAFSQPINYALGFVIAGVAYLLIGGIVIKVMKSRLAGVDPVPHKSVDELRKDKQWLKKEL